MINPMDGIPDPKMAEKWGNINWDETNKNIKSNTAPSCFFLPQKSMSFPF